MTDRLSQDDYLWRLAFQVAVRSTCNREHHGCVIARDGRVLSTGYNGSVAGEKHCDEIGHELVQMCRVYEKDYGKLGRGYSFGGTPFSMPASPEIHCVRTIHAEQNAILNAAAVGIGVERADWYITGVPCQTCRKMILQLKPHRVFICHDRGWTKAPAIMYLDNQPVLLPFCELKKRGVVPDDFRGDHDVS